MSTTTYDLFFTGRDDPRSCVIIGEDSRPVYFCFETTERSMMSNVRTMVYRNDKEFCAKLEWSPGNHLGGVTIGSRELHMSNLVSPGSCIGARAFVSADGSTFEWRRDRENPASYDLYAHSNRPIGAFRRFPKTKSTAVGPSHAHFQYSFNHDLLLTEALVALCINRWIDLHGV
ncbi:hypothetical protein CPB83DRAFT_845262 [Crepidotus variabilis]|uniref:DUF6593 domain-containing protein n=1 Tax=Crepidotus variabilis TaxID=179855 RepID=A0A9P6ERP6_9AGAR|nr:hypothetical protein CPB83DRAFT_845262 [Crepidotus variabilis]